MLPSVRRRATLLVLVAALLAALVATVPGQAAQAADDKGLVNGAIKFPQHDQPGLKMLWFDGDWTYVGQKALGRVDGYSMWLEPGTYHLQFVDQRPSYDITKYAPTDIQVTVRASDITTRTVTMRKGAVITGTAKAGGKALGGARLVAANTARQSFSTTANSKGEFAIGGLPQGRYSVFTYDKRMEWVGKSAWAGAIKPGQAKNLAIRLTQRSGSMTVYLFTPDGRLRTTTPVTITSNKTGQWWTATARSGTAVFKGLYPGGYTLKFDGAGVWFARTGAVQRATVKSGQMAFGKFSITTRGGWITGTVVDSRDSSRALSGAVVQLWSADGTKLDETVSGDDGFYLLDGQLATQSGLDIVVQPGPYTDYLGEEPLRCQYIATTNTGFSVVTGEENWVADAAVIDRKPGQTRPECVTTSTGGRARP